MPNQQIMTWNNLLPASMATAILTLLTTAVTTSAAPTNDLLGHIQVLNTTSFATANPADAIGCLDTRGRLVRDDCAVFSQLANAPHTFSTSAGVCTFRNTSRPANTDSMYGKGNHAWWCGDKLNDPVVESYYPAVSTCPPFSRLVRSTDQHHSWNSVQGEERRRGLLTFISPSMRRVGQRL